MTALEIVACVERMQYHVKASEWHVDRFVDRAVEHATAGFHEAGKLLDVADRATCDLAKAQREITDLQDSLATHCACTHDGRGTLVTECEEHQTQRESWRCFQCGMVLTTAAEAQNHFGRKACVSLLHERERMRLSDEVTRLQAELAGQRDGEAQEIVTLRNQLAAMTAQRDECEQALGIAKARLMRDPAYLSRDYARLWDLVRSARSGWRRSRVRSQRGELFDAGLITRDEYVALLGDETQDTPNTGSPSPRRLESYYEIVSQREVERHNHAKALADAQAEALAMRRERDREIHARVEAERASLIGGAK